MSPARPDKGSGRPPESAHDSAKSLPGVIQKILEKLDYSGGDIILAVPCGPWTVKVNVCRVGDDELTVGIFGDVETSDGNYVTEDGVLHHATYLDGYRFEEGKLIRTVACIVGVKDDRVPDGIISKTPHFPLPEIMANMVAGNYTVEQPAIRAVERARGAVETTLTGIEQLDTGTLEVLAEKLLDRQRGWTRLV